MDTTIIQVILSGILVGAVYGLAALGLSLAFGVLKVLNVAHGALIMLGAYATFYMFTLLAIDPYVSMGIVFILLAFFGLLLYALVFRHVIRLDEENRIKNSLLIGFGLILILQTIAVRAFSADERSVITSYASAAWTIGDIRVPLIRLSGLVLAIIAVIILERFLTRTYLGKALRATSEDWATAALTGIDIRRVYFIAFAIATGLAGITGVMIATGFSINPNIGLSWTLKALIVVVLAGLGSMRGTLLGGLILGVAEALSAYYFGGEYREIVGLILFLIILSVRPQGLFGEKHV
ncbi:MAG: branched-chain amino acid ABC transporter permease [Candidatus Promineifilaceae bacterium]|nr:branched-chain amino acid ABC transporter permease [Candidatus Promineifilaceae bacterium]